MNVKPQVGLTYPTGDLLRGKVGELFKRWFDTLGLICIMETCETKVHYLYLFVAGDHDVRRFDVAVCDQPLMGILQTVDGWPTIYGGLIDLTASKSTFSFQSMTRLRHLDNLNTARFVTFTCYHGFPLLDKKEARDIFLNHLQSFRERTGVKLLGYVVMPEHVHLVLFPPSGVLLGREVGKLKAYSAMDIIKLLDSVSEYVPERQRSDVKAGKSRAIWQRRCYDHNCRTRETTIEKINYCHNNPVKRGLVTEPADWPWSSYRWYHGFDSLLPMDLIE